MAKKEKTTTAVAKIEKPANLGLLSMFGPATTKELPKNIVRRNLPPMVKPGDVPVGVTVSGVIVKFINSMNSTIKGKLIWLRHESGKEFLLPLTGQIRTALFPGIKTMKDGQVDYSELDKAIEKGEEVGKTLFATRGANAPSKYKREMFGFDVYTTDK